MPAASEIHILLVEDYEPMLKVTIRILNDLGGSGILLNDKVVVATKNMTGCTQR